MDNGSFEEESFWTFYAQNVNAVKYKKVYFV